MELVCSTDVSTDVDQREYVRFLDAFAAEPGTALAYHYPFYLKFLAHVAYPNSTVRLVTARQGGEIVGVMPAVQVRTPQVNAWLSLAYFGPNGGALVRRAGHAEGRATVQALATAAREDARARACGSMTIYTPLDADPAPYEAALGPVDFNLTRTTQCVAIPEEPALSPWPRRVRYDIRRAAALGVTVRPMASGGELDAVWDLYRAGCEDAGIPIKPRDHVRRLYDTAGDHGVFLVAEHEGAIIAGLICFQGGGVLSYYLPCTRVDKRPLQPGLLLLDRAVAIGRAAGCRLLNFERSPGAEDSGDSVYRFKARCGGQPVPYRVLVTLLRPGVVDDYRALTADGLRREAPHAFIIPFEALA